jgi:hypothetical protein
MCPKEFGYNNYATKKTITQGLLDIALLTANASQLKFVLEVGETHPYYVLLVTLLAVSIALQVTIPCPGLCHDVRDIWAFSAVHPSHAIAFRPNTSRRRVLETLAVPYRIYNYLPPVPIPSHTNPIHIPKLYFFLRFIFILYSNVRLSLRCDLIPFRLPSRNSVLILSRYARYIPHPSHSPSYDYLNNSWRRVQSMEFIVQFCLPCYFFIPS